MRDAQDIYCALYRRFLERCIYVEMAHDFQVPAAFKSCLLCVSRATVHALGVDRIQLSRVAAAAEFRCSR